MQREKEREDAKHGGAAGGQPTVAFQTASDSPVAKEDEEEGDEVGGVISAPEGAKFETLSDGSTALSLQPGDRLKLNLEHLLRGGDARKEERVWSRRARTGIAYFGVVLQGASTDIGYVRCAGEGREEKEAEEGEEDGAGRVVGVHELGQSAMRGRAS
eukprot:508950-Rhodomonas_salina.4